MDADAFIENAIDVGGAMGMSALSPTERAVFLISEAEVATDMGSVLEVARRLPRLPVAPLHRLHRLPPPRALTLTLPRRTQARESHQPTHTETST